ncbi:MULTISPECIES: cellulase family glycosylhydrolase [unclassified Coprococcus]|jgi:endoglucanase|uniref:cellulase family glycosylhydrolase n=1 Tax=unclassified Coprococcus TaxID=2684943 RepID=UPI000E4E5D09|nr:MULTISPECIES: cellulase family glycosylhydrolase [unclassified Coprococcus]RGI35551.1 endoglucanase [Coprococcus sp. OM06-34AC]RGI42866.1 endoglucanase [Coprococcus sp. OM06-25]
MKNKKTIVMGIIIGVLLIIIAVMGYVIASGKKGDSVKKETLQETSAGTEEVKSADNTGDTTESSEKQDDQSLDIADDFYAEIGHDTTWEADGKKCATESINIYNNTSASAKDWKLEITYKGTPAVDQIWGGEYKISGKTVSIKAVDYTQEIPAKGSINLGYNFSSDDLDVEKYVLYVNDTQYSGDGLKMVASAPEKTDSNETSGGGKNTESAATEKKNNTNVPGEIPFETHGKLSVKGTDIVDMNGDKYQLKGVSTHGITWFPDYVNKEAFETLRDDWGANLIRLAMYTDTGDSYGYCSGGDKDEILALVDKGVSAATELGMYVIVDWHILSDSDPNNHIDDAKEFFDKVSKKYAAQENVIYEICNEPNGGTQWSSVKSYAETIIPVIRANDKDALIIVGTPNWSQDVDIASQDPITGYDNIMYAVHFYAATHKDDLRNKVKTALDNGLPVFVSEFSLCDASGNGGIDYDSSDEWFELINENNLSYSSWSLCNKNETSALIKSDSTATGSFSDGDLSDTGKYVRDRIMGK